MRSLSSIPLGLKLAVVLGLMVALVSFANDLALMVITFFVWIGAALLLARGRRQDRRVRE